MKRAVAIAIALAASGCSGGFEKMPDADVDAAQKENALRIGTKLWSRCTTGAHEKLSSDEAIPAMVSGLTPDRMAAACSAARSQYGEFSTLDYAETWRPKSGTLRVYRFKGRFSNASTPPEIRVVMDGTKLSGLWIKPWSDALR